MDLMPESAQRDMIVGLLAAAAVFFSVVVVSWPYLVPSQLDGRMRQIAQERERIRQRGRRASAEADAPPRPARSPFSRLVGLLGLGEAADSEGVMQKLQSAGFRGRSAAVTFIGIRIVVPVAMFTITLLYVASVLPIEQPFAMDLLIALASALVGYLLPGILLKNRILKRQQSVQRAWPDALDLLLICVQSGMAIEPALQKVSEEIGTQSVELAEELGITTAELSFLPSRIQAYENLSRRTGLECVKSVVASLKQAEKQGTSIGRSLRVLAQENRDTRLSLAEKKAAALPPKLTVPMILFFLPVLFVVILTPSVIRVMEVM